MSTLDALQVRFRPVHFVGLRCVVAYIRHYLAGEGTVAYCSRCTALVCNCNLNVHMNHSYRQSGTTMHMLANLGFFVVMFNVCVCVCVSARVHACARVCVCDTAF